MQARRIREKNIQLAETFPAFKVLYERSPQEFRSYFQMNGDIFGRMSPRGNWEIARVAAAALGVTPPTDPLQPVQTNNTASAEYRDLLPYSEQLDRFMRPTPHSTITPGGSEGSGPRSFRITALGPPGEHYLSTEVKDVPGGRLTLSF